MENLGSSEEVEATIVVVSQKYEKYETISQKEVLQKVSEGTLSVYAASKKYGNQSDLLVDIIEQ